MCHCHRNKKASHLLTYFFFKPSETLKIIENLYINCSNIMYPICDQEVESDNLCGFSAHFFLEGGTRHLLILM